MSSAPHAFSRTSTAVVVAAADPALRLRAGERAKALGLPFVEVAQAGTLALVLDDLGWSLLDPAPGAPGAVRADLVGGGLGDRLRGGGRGEGRLASALGLKRHPGARVLDATAGLGRESAIAAALGCTVIACERSPIVATLLRDGIDRAARDLEVGPDLASILARIDLRVADARDVLATLSGPERPDVVLVDPMFPERSKAARAKKEMQLLQRLLGPDDPADTVALVEAALASARRRVILKRPAHAPQLAGVRPPDLEVPGRAARYDVYVISPPKL